MILALQQPVSFDEFIAWYPENTGVHYELRRGVIIEMPKPRGQHSEIAGFIAKHLNYAIDQTQQPYFMPKECIIKAPDEATGYEPDGIVLDREAVTHELRWQQSSVIENGASIKLVIEVVSTNWRDDYLKKFADYEAMGIQEYWIVDYAALGARRYLGNPKQPTLFVCTLVDGEYQMSAFCGGDRILSPTFPALQLTADQVFRAGASN